MGFIGQVRHRRVVVVIAHESQERSNGTTGVIRDKFDERLKVKRHVAD